MRICLAEKKLEWESRHVDIVKKRDNFKKWYLKINSNGVVPTLEHDGCIVVESNIILEYLDDCFPDTRLKPRDPFQIEGKKGAGSSWRGWSALIALKIAPLERSWNSESKYIFEKKSNSVSKIF